MTSGECQQRSRGDVFKESRQRLQLAMRNQLFRNSSDDSGQSGELSFEDRLAVDPDSFSERNQMRRSEESGANSSGSANRIKKCRRRSFAVRARNLNRRKILVWISQSFE